MTKLQIGGPALQEGQHTVGYLAEDPRPNEQGVVGPGDYGMLRLEFGVIIDASKLANADYLVKSGRARYIEGAPQERLVEEELI